MSESDKNNPMSSFFDEERFDLIKFLLASAKSATSNDMGELAIHLYYSAFELSRAGASDPGEEVIEGMRKAWQIACSLPDRSIAEAIHASLTPYNTPEQTESGVYALQKLAMDQLSTLGIPDDVIDKVSASIAILDEEGIGGKTKAGTEFPIVIPVESVANGEGGFEGRIQLALPIGEGQEKSVTEKNDRLTYQNLKGYGNLIDEMGYYGIVKPEDSAALEFLKNTSEFHGVDNALAFRPLFFHGKSRDDVNMFAYSTAGQLGYPILHVKIVMNEDGSGSLKMQGPFRKSFFGPQDPTDIPLPCVFLIENLDMLHALMTSEESENIYVAGPMGMQTQASMCEELLSYISLIIEKEEVCLLLTSVEDFEFCQEFQEVFGCVDYVEVADPDTWERIDIWQKVYSDHPSFMDIDMHKLVMLSDGMSRYDIEDMGKRVAAEAYRESIATKSQIELNIYDVLMEMKEYFDIESDTYKHIEDEIVKDFNSNLTQDL